MQVAAAMISVAGRVIPIMLLGGCELFFDGTSESPVMPSMEGSWTLERSIASIDPVPPTTTPCTQGFTTGFQPSTMTIINEVVATDYGMPLMNVTFGGGHDLSFDAQEYWNTVGWNNLVTLHYEFDQTDAKTLHGVVIARPPAGWPSGTCDYKYIIVSSLVVE